ncbi:MAG TPA: transglycosylase domain-containing protein [Candidatus Absconditabacterales bacterium]|nr:transglycosylase domain-containing protein [Candidatus Absconditabacterales bacterium]
MKSYKIKSKKYKSKSNKLISPSNYKKSKRGKLSRKKLFQVGIIFAGVFFIALFVLFQVRIKGDLPDINQIRDITFSQATVITDRNDNVLYKLFSENREYVEYSGINKNMINAIVAVEDQRYREHNGLDTIGLFRAVFSKIIRPSSRMQGASTITQQLVRNLLLTQDRKVERKLKEMVLTKKLDSVLEDMIKDSVGKLDSERMKHQKKELTLELYLNKIAFGNNAFGIESASKTYFGKSAIDLTVLESSILASIPKGPTAYNPYTKRSATIGNLKITDNDGNEYSLSNTGLKSEVVDKIESIMSKSNFSNKKEYSSFSKYLNGLIDFSLYLNGTKYNVKYSVGRKDLVLSRMFQDEYITEEQLKEALLEGMIIKLKSAGFTIEAPHFVMRVTELLEEQYDEETLMNGGLVVKTTLDLDIQDIAEQSIQNNVDALDMYGATNEAMIYLDSQNGDVLAYIGSVDYFNEDIGGQNDMIRNARQVGSSMKPFIYSLGFSILPLTLDTPIYDIPFKIGPDRPNNADGKFLGIIPLKKALAYSRNVPAAKMITAIGGQDVALPFLRKLGLTSLDPNGDYGYPLAFGAGEVPMIELANAYSHLSAGKPGEINPILEVRTHDGSLLYEKEEKLQDQIIAPGIVYLIRNILSNSDNMPPERVAKYAVRGLQMGLKSGTSNMKTPKGDRARDGRLATYTPSKVAIFRGGNADGSPMYRNAYGGFLNADAMTEFWSTLVANNLVSDEGMSAVEVAESNISKISGKLAGEGTPGEFVVKSMGYIDTQPTEYDPGMTPVEFDGSCNGLASPYTPADELKKGYIISPTTFMPGHMDLNEITMRWQRSTNPDLLSDFDPELSGKVNFNYDNMLLAMPQDYCVDRSPQISEDINIDIKNLQDGQKISTKPMVRFSVSAPNNIRRVSISINDRVIGSMEYRGDSNQITDVMVTDLGDEFGNGELTLLAVDTEGYSNRKSINVSLVSNDTVAPFVLKDITSVRENDGRYRVIIFFNDKLSSVNGGTIKQGDKTLKTFAQNIAEFNMNEPGIVDIYAKDGFGNELYDTLDIRDYIEGYEYPEVVESEITEPEVEEIVEEVVEDTNSTGDITE